MSDLEVWDDILDANSQHISFCKALTSTINKAPGGAVIRINSRDALHTSRYSNRSKAGYRWLHGGSFEDVREYGTKVCTINPGIFR